MYNWKWLTFHNVVPQLVLHLRQASLLRIELRSLAELLRVSVFSFIGHFCHEISYVLWVSLESSCKNRCLLTTKIEVCEHWFNNTCLLSLTH